jgi:hypothetical protein
MKKLSWLIGVGLMAQSAQTQLEQKLWNKTTDLKAAARLFGMATKQTADKPFQNPGVDPVVRQIVGDLAEQAAYGGFVMGALWEQERRMKQGW